ncbi:MAG: hypothetical protein JSW61_03360 [Candidatus Thorarchaeota archaeon]|nr:MAG: hypothetical protein JSW61_03360 [Candidatus Thorarchaeota archaeon]
MTQTTVNPGERAGHAMVYDPHNDVVVLFGGYSFEGGYHSLSDTWLYTYESSNWTELSTTPSPSSRSNLGMVYANATNEIILYGGGQATDTWSFDCQTQTWSEVETDANPGVHYSHAMAYDSQNNAVILYGGFGAGGELAGDIWKFDVSSREWTELQPSTMPLDRYGHVMTYDETIAQIVMCCGNTAFQGHQDDTWTFDVSSDTWTRITTMGNPDRLKWPSMVYDPVNHKSILFGGQVGDTSVDGTWIFDAQSSSWTDPGPDSSPRGRINTGLAFVPAFEIVVLYGGMGTDYGGTFNDTWAYSYENNTWTDLSEIDTTTTHTDTTTTTNTTTTTGAPPPEFPLGVLMIPAAVIVVGSLAYLIRLRSLRQ